jgi:hypothetical protein
VNLLREKQRALGYMPCKGGGGTSSSATLQTTTINSDSRAVLQDAVQVGANAHSTVNFNTSQADAEVLRTLANNMPDAMRALGQAGATIIKDAGGAVVDLNRDSVAANTKAWDSTLHFGAQAVDDVIDMMGKSFGIASENIKAGNAIASQAIDKFQPTENANADIGKYAMFAAAAVAAAVLLSRDQK